MSDNKNKEQVEYLSVKLENRRIKVVYYVDKDCVRVMTKRLISFEDREIAKTDNLYSKETLYGISHLLDLMLEGSKEMRSFWERGSHNFSEEHVKGHTNLGKLVTEE